MKMNFNSHNSYISKISKHFEQMQNRNQRTPTKSTRSSPQPPIIQKTVNHEISPPPSNKHSHYPHPRTPIKLIHTRPTFTPPRSVDPFLSAVRATLSTVGSSRLSSIRARSHQRGSSARLVSPPLLPPPPRLSTTTTTTVDGVSTTTLSEQRRSPRGEGPRGFCARSQLAEMSRARWGSRCSFPR